MADERAKRGVGPILSAWMADVAPERAPERLFEEAFARTMVAPQARIYPWQRLARPSRHPRRLTLLSIAAAAALLVGVLGFGVFGGGSGFGPGPSPIATPAVSAPSPPTR